MKALQHSSVPRSSAKRTPKRKRETHETVFGRLRFGGGKDGVEVKVLPVLAGDSRASMALGSSRQSIYLQCAQGSL